VRTERSPLPTGKVAAFRRSAQPVPDLPDLPDVADAPKPLEAEADPLLAFASEDDTNVVAQPSRLRHTVRKREPERPSWTPTWIQVAVAALMLGQIGLLGVWMVRRAQDTGAASTADAPGAADAATAADAASAADATGAAGALNRAAAADPASAATTSPPAKAAAAPEAVAPAAPAKRGAPAASAAARATRVAPASAFARGWLSITSPIQAQIFENSSLVGSTHTRHLSLSAGRHNLEFVNNALGYREHRTVEINGSQITSITLDMPRGTVHVNALPWAEVWIDGAHVGDTPLSNLSLPIGTHDIVFRHPQYGAQRRVIVVGTTQTLHIGVDLRKAP
jgi:hypothetical protein